VRAPTDRGRARRVDRNCALGALLVLALVGCKDKSPPKGLPPAQEWNAKSGDLPPVEQPQQQQAETPDEAEPNAPDPDREIDPAHHIRGEIKVHAKVKDKAKPGAALFVIAKQVGADGAPAGPPLAVQKLTWHGERVAFELTDANAMIAGTALDGEVIVTAHYDQDGDALTKQPGDIFGTLKVKVPAEGVTIWLDAVQ